MFGMMMFACIAMQVEEEEVFRKILANDVACVRAYQEDKIYLQAERILPTEHGVYLDLNGRDYIVLPQLHSDAEGCFVPLKLSIENHKTCKLCGSKYILRCRNGECPGNKKTRQDSLIDSHLISNL